MLFGSPQGVEVIGENGNPLKAMQPDSIKAFIKF
jgi:hypothetical protein